MAHAPDEGLQALNKTLDRLQDELLQERPRRSHRDILKDIDRIEGLIEDHENSGQST
jgi:hypothetical protein